jgi:hypothetical protein
MPSLRRMVDTRLEVPTRLALHGRRATGISGATELITLMRLTLSNCSLVGLVCDQACEKVIKSVKISLGTHEEITD